MIDFNIQKIVPACSEFGLDLDQTATDRLNTYGNLLVSWNEKINLTAITEPREVAVKHIVDSLSAYDAALFGDGAPVIDVGTGAGFPGIPLKILRPDLRLTLLDSLQKRVGFLREVVSALGLAQTECVHARAEEVARQKTYRERFDVAVSRAVARLAVLAEYTLPFVRLGGSFLALNGAKYREETQEAGAALKLLGGGLPEIRPVKLPGLDDARAIVRIEKLRPTPAAYPRKAGTPEKKPLGVK